MSPFVRYTRNSHSQYKPKILVLPDKCAHKVKMFYDQCSSCQKRTKDPFRFFALVLDKYLAYHLVELLGISIPQQYYAGSMDETLLRKIKAPYILKSPHGAGGFEMGVVNRNHNVSFQQIGSKVSGVVNLQDPQKRPLVIAEEFIPPIGNDVLPCDYKAFVFNGVLECFFVRHMDTTKTKLLKSPQFEPSTKNFTRKIKLFDKKGKASCRIYTDTQVVNKCDERHRLTQAQLEQLTDYCARLSVLGEMLMRFDFYKKPDGQLVFGEFCGGTNGGHGFTKQFEQIMNQTMKKHGIKFRQPEDLKEQIIDLTNHD